MEQAFVSERRRDRLIRFRMTQRAYRKVATQIRMSVRDVVGTEKKLRGQIVLVWGAGSFGATSRGHDSAPNKSLRKGLSRFFPIIMCSEYRTSQVCAACQGEVVHGKGPKSKLQLKRVEERLKKGGRRMPWDGPTKVIRGLFHCNNCHICWSRDGCACLNILNIFWHQVRTGSLSRPKAYQPKA